MSAAVALGGYRPGEADPVGHRTRRHGGPDLRGSVYDRRRRKRWLLDTYGNGTTAPCAHCGRELTYPTLTVDRIVPGADGGRYTHDNVQPSCEPCNRDRGATPLEDYTPASFVTPF